MILRVKIPCTKSSSRSRNHMIFFEDAKKSPSKKIKSLTFLILIFTCNFWGCKKIILNNFLKIIYSFYILKNSLFFLVQFFFASSKKTLNFSETEKIINHPHEVKIRKILRHGFFLQKSPDIILSYNLSSRNENHVQFWGDIEEIIIKKWK